MKIKEPTIFRSAENLDPITVQSFENEQTEYEFTLPPIIDDPEAAARLAKQTEEAAAEQWKSEAQTLEDTVRRLTRALSNKDSLLKDLRTKIDEQQEREEKLNKSKDTKEKAAGATTAALSGDLLNLTHAELRTKLRSSETERLKIRSRLHNLHDRFLETQAECQKIKEELENANKIESKVDHLRFQLARREAQVRSLKLKLETLKEDTDKALEKAERKAHDVQVQYDAVREMIKKDDIAKKVHSKTRDRKSRSPSPSREKSAAPRYDQVTASSSSKIKPLVGPAAVRAAKKEAQSPTHDQLGEEDDSIEESDESEEPAPPPPRKHAKNKHHIAKQDESDETSDDEANEDDNRRGATRSGDGLPEALGSETNKDLADILAQLSGKI